MTVLINLPYLFYCRTSPIQHWPVWGQLGAWMHKQSEFTNANWDKNCAKGLIIITIYFPSNSKQWSVNKDHVRALFLDIYHLVTTKWWGFMFSIYGSVHVSALSQSKGFSVWYKKYISNDATRKKERATHADSLTVKQTKICDMWHLKQQDV